MVFLGVLCALVVKNQFMMPAVAILVGGLATRLHPLTQDVPKALLAVAGKPFIAHQLALLKRNEITQVVICAGYLGEQIQEVVKDGAAFGLHAAYAFDGPQLRGTGGALKNALPQLSDPFWVLYGDSYLDVDFAPILAAYRAQRKPGLMTVFCNDGQWDASNIEYRDHVIIRYDKTQRTPAMRYIDYGLALLSKACFDHFTQAERFDLAAVYQDVIQRGEMAGDEVTQRFYEIGSFQGLQETEAYLRNYKNSE